MQKAFYNISEMAAILGLTPAAIYAHLSRKNFEAVPPPVYLGRRLAWPVMPSEEWIAQKVESVINCASQTKNVPHKIGRPTKVEANKRKNGK